MRMTSLPTQAGESGQVARRSRPWWTAQLAPADSVGGALDPAAPRALWRLVHIGEMAGLIQPSDESLILDAFRGPEQGRPAIAAELTRFRCSITDLYVLVTLFSAAPRPVPLFALPRETLAEPMALRRSLDRLDETGTITTRAEPHTEPTLELTSTGFNLAVFVTYRVIRAGISPNLTNLP